MKKLTLIILTIIIIWWIIFIKYFFEQKNLNIEKIKDSIVIIIPENELISYKNNPKWIINDYKESWIWAGFFIDNKWSIQTVNHIVKNNEINYKIIHNNKEYNSEIILRNNKRDLAIIKIIINKKVNFSYLKKWIGKNFEQVYSFWVEKDYLKIIYNTWNILNKNIKLEEISNLIEISNTLIPWFSWWPVINSKWEVIWINYATYKWKNYIIEY